MTTTEPTAEDGATSSTSLGASTVLTTGTVAATSAVQAPSAGPQINALSDPTRTLQAFALTDWRRTPARRRSLPTPAPTSTCSTWVATTSTTC